MTLRTLGLLAGLALASNAQAITLGLIDGTDLGTFGAPTTYGETFAVTSVGSFDHDLSFTITEPLYAGSGIANIPLSVDFGSFELKVTDIDNLAATIYDSNDVAYATFEVSGSPDLLTLPTGSFFAPGDYTLKVTGETTGQNGGFYVVAAVTVPVPEAQTWGMLLVGLAAVALRMRQRLRATPRSSLA